MGDEWKELRRAAEALNAILNLIPRGMDNFFFHYVSETDLGRLFDALSKFGECCEQTGTYYRDLSQKSLWGNLL